MGGAGPGWSGPRPGAEPGRKNERETAHLGAQERRADPASGRGDLHCREVDESVDVVRAGEADGRRVRWRDVEAAKRGAEAWEELPRAAGELPDDEHGLSTAGEEVGAVRGEAQRAHGLRVPVVGGEGQAACGAPGGSVPRESPVYT